MLWSKILLEQKALNALQQRFLDIRRSENDISKRAFALYRLHIRSFPRTLPAQVDKRGRGRRHHARQSQLRDQRVRATFFHVCRRSTCVRTQ